MTRTTITRRATTAYNKERYPHIDAIDASFYIFNDACQLTRQGQAQYSCKRSLKVLFWNDRDYRNVRALLIAAGCHVNIIKTPAGKTRLHVFEPIRCSQ